MKIWSKMILMHHSKALSWKPQYVTQPLLFMFAIKALEAAPVFSWMIGVTTQTIRHVSADVEGDKVKNRRKDFAKCFPPFHKVSCFQIIV